MRKIRLLSILLFILTLAAYMGMGYLQKKGGSAAMPTISMDEDTVTVSVTDDASAMLQGITAESGGKDITDRLLIESVSNFISPGKRQMTVAAVDESDHVTRAVRTVLYEDYVSPRFQLDAPLNFNLGVLSFMDDMTVEDVLDGDLSMNIKMTSENKVLVDTPGEYPVTFSVANSAGDVTSLPVTVTMLDPAEKNTAPEIHLKKYIAYKTVGDHRIGPWNYVENLTLRGKTYVPDKDGDGNPIFVLQSQTEDPDTYDPDDENYVLRNIRITNNVDMKTAGVYEVVYQVTVSGSDGKHTGTVRLVVVVEEGE